MMHKSIVLAALLGMALAAPKMSSLKQKLAQNGNGGGGSVGSGTDACDISALADDIALPTLPFQECAC